MIALSRLKNFYLYRNNCPNMPRDPKSCGSRTRSTFFYLSFCALIPILIFTLFFPLPVICEHVILIKSPKNRLWLWEYRNFVFCLITATAKFRVIKNILWSLVNLFLYLVIAKTIFLNWEDLKTNIASNAYENQNRFLTNHITFSVLCICKQVRDTCIQFLIFIDNCIETQSSWFKCTIVFKMFVRILLDHLVLYL